MSIVPLNDRLIVRKTEMPICASIGLQANPHLRLLAGEIVSVGDEVCADSLQVGDTVLFNPISVIHLSIDHADHFLLREGDLLALINVEAECELDPRAPPKLPACRLGVVQGNDN